MEVIKIDVPSCSAVVALQGAQLLSWTPRNCIDSIVWCAEERFWTPGKPVRGGVPVCWPWFGKQKQPGHGFARLLDWKLVKQEKIDTAQELVFELKDSPWTRELWPWPFRLRLRMILGTFCQLDFEVDCEAETTAALHTYFQVGDIGQTRVHGLGPVYQDALQGLKMCPAADVLETSKPLDRIYTEPELVTQLEDASLGRRISMEHRGHSDLVVWNPGLDGAHALGDLDAKQYANFLCVETAAVNQSVASGLGVTFKG